MESKGAELAMGESSERTPKPLGEFKSKIPI